MADRTRIQELLNRYAWGQDQGELTILEECLTDAAVLSVSQPNNGSVGPIVGKENVLAYLSKDIANRSGPQRHLVSNVFLEEENTAAATVVSYLTVASVRDGAPAIVATGWTRDRVMFEGGKWRISSRQLTFDTAQ
jgi:hypothetical protein